MLENMRRSSGGTSSGIFTMSCPRDLCRPPHSPAIENRGNESSFLVGSWMLNRAWEVIPDER